MRSSIAVVAALLVLAACGGKDTGSADTGVGDKEVATGGRLFKTADAETAKLGSDAQPGVFPRTVKHALGEAKLDKKPEKIVVLDSGELDDVLALGITPVGMATNTGQNGVPSYLADKAQGIKTVGGVSDLNLEAIANLKPDLILGSKLRANDLFDKLNEIAPTVMSIRPGFPWKENFLLVADAVGEEDKATQILNDYQKRADEVKGKVEGAPTISLVRFRPAEIRLYGNLSFIGVILKDVGLPRPKVQDVQELAVEVSEENIGQADGDWIFYSSFGPITGTAESKVVNGNLWKALPAVKAGQAERVNDEVWFLGLGPLGAMDTLTDLEKLLSKKN
ncbi:iron-siderophore ABC transporter substrate-binding protein [Kribbella sandramycini]|uniref:Iron complex transport system substrate-binding protein n=1 Tax=Kribbella sandramycini TaxID=60450 RepID=A0A7Y4NYQ5_9ACTN|nr:iron-siderophore ABC transporter substrate-binding protein [Kribbella sandramycini]MBB6568011.1 iron complex transport system substrate-binding protein [Kribbella sandramycini]NOL39395.1 iron-siderophore ABC transporter substrate-binding protein [Kribbella sandramycini]